MSLAVFGMYCCYKCKLELRIWLAYLTAFVIAFGSFCGHGTLLFELQLLDELPMIYWAAMCAYITLEDGPKRKHGMWLPAVLFVYCAGVTLACVFTPDAVFHEQAFGVLVAIMVLRSAPWMFGGKNATAKRTRRILYGVTILSLGTAFFLWNMDNIHCGLLTSTRAQIGFPLAPLLELHAWWHILTAVAIHFASTMATFVRCETLDQDAVIVWKAGVFPVLEMVESKSD
jgi:dihydroceramidase